MKYRILLPSLLFFVLLCLAELSHAQSDAEIEIEETGIWSGLYFKGKIKNNIGYYGEHHFRQRNAIDNVYSFAGRTRQIYNRAGINITFNRYFEVVIGPTLVLNFTPEPGNSEYDKVVYEPRIWHQWLFIMPPMGRYRIYHQFRFEHRWKKGNAINEDFDYTNRYRYKIFAYIPLNSETIENKTIYFSPSAEIFMHSGESIIFNPFEDFRTYNGFGYVMNRQMTLFVGHMWTMGQKNSGFEYKTSHIIRLNLFIGLDFRRIDNKLPPINLGY